MRHGAGIEQDMKLLIVFLFLFVCVGCGILPQSPYRQALPQTASDIKEYRSGVVDFTYLLRAKVTGNEFSDYVKYFGLLPNKLNEISEKNRHLKRERQASDFFPSWWSTIRPGVDIVFGKRDKADIISAKYEEGFLFLHVTHI